MDVTEKKGCYYLKKYKRDFADVSEAPPFYPIGRIEAEGTSVATAAAVTVVAEQAVDQVGERSVSPHAEQEGEKERQSAPFEQVGKAEISIRQNEGEDQDPE